MRLPGCVVGGRIQSGRSARGIARWGVVRHARLGPFLAGRLLATAVPDGSGALPDEYTFVLSAGRQRTLRALAAVANSGLRRLSAPSRARTDVAATALSRTGPAHAAALLQALPATAGALDTAEAAAAWLEAQPHILVSGGLPAAGSGWPRSRPAEIREPRVDPGVSLHQPTRDGHRVDQRVQGERTDSRGP